MTSLSFKYHTQKTDVNSKGLTTIYFFDVWEWRISKEIFDKISIHTNIAVVEEYPIKINGCNVANHCGFLDQPNAKELVIPANGRIRISMAALVKISYENKSIYLIQNKTIKPFGGAYYFTKKPSINSLALDNPQSMDLRFTVDVLELDKVYEWFNLKQDREITPERELFEELCLENNILDKSDFTL